MKKQFVTYEIAKSLKELGFDEKCLGYYRNPDEFFITENGRGFNYNKASWAISAPLWQQVVDWFDKVYNLLIVVKYDKIYGYKWDIRGKKNKPLYRCAVTYQRLCDAREESILEAIELCKNKK